MHRELQFLFHSSSGQVNMVIRDPVASETQHRHFLVEFLLLRIPAGENLKDLRKAGFFVL